MLRLPTSPRARRRLLRSAGAAALALVVLGLALLIPSKGPSNAAPTGPPRPAQLAVDTHARLARPDRIAIDRLLDRFFPAAVAREDAETAWALAGPEMRRASSLADFRKGTSPVPYYPVRERTFHDWRAVDVERRSVVLDILVHPKAHVNLGAWVFSTEVVKVRGRWLVNRIYTIAVMNPAQPTHELGPRDYAAPPPTQRNRSTATPGSHSFLLPAVGLFALILLVPAGFGGVALLRARRWRRAVGLSGRTELPPLPASYRREPEEEPSYRREPEDERAPASHP